ncbi:hypothetical protein QMT40_002095 [Parvibaculaceae bacterium PLY_AMNH_Bact1]|nr:hypothetical protein QMT40_002095 [Parvibaculaceae bacterium PLY_AMNH_Bact1]
MTESNPIRLLASLFRPGQNDARPTVLLGAGASFSSGIPLASQCVKRIARRVYAERELGGRVLPERIKPSEWQAWLQRHDWFLAGEDKLAENFPLVVEHLLRPEAYRRKVLMDLVHLDGDIGSGYHSLSELVLRGLAGTILTTNFDICLPQALRERHPHIRYVAEVNRGPDDFNEFDLYARAQIVWLHGKTEQYTDRNLVNETDSLSDKLTEHLGPLLDNTPLIVAGYRGAEKSVMDSLLGERSGRLFRQGVFWCTLEGEGLHENVVRFKERLGPNFHHLEVKGFDQLFDGLNRELVDVKRYFDVSSVLEVPGFDDLPSSKAGWGDINSDLALSVLRQYSSKVGMGALQSDQLKPFMRDLGLLVATDNGERPSSGAVLLFGREPQRFFPHAVVSATVDHKRRRVFSGNLIEQHRELHEWLEGGDVNPPLKLKGKRVHKDQSAYNERALSEVLMNLLVHRDYAIEELATINVTTSVGIDFENPGGISVETADRLNCDAEGKFEPIPQFSELRNRSLCDVFFGLSAMERAGTGLADTVELSQSNGGGASFTFPPGRDHFMATLYQPEASAGSTGVARATIPVGTYVVNMLPFTAVPESMQRAYVPGGWNALKRYAQVDELGTFILEKRSDTFLSFAPAAVLSLLLGDALEGDIDELPTDSTFQDKVTQRYMSWLMRKHFEGHLASFSNDGLTLEKDKRGRPTKRAFFTGVNGANRMIVYDTPRRTGISRGVAKKREVGRNTWFECEGIGYEVVSTSSLWGVRIKPFYMFTKPDGKTALPGYLRSKKSTSRFKFDRNANVDSDLVFWERFLSRGEQIINIGGAHADDLLLDGSFFTVDVEEKGLVPDDPSDENKYSA